MPFKQVFETALTDVWTAAQGLGTGGNIAVADKPGDIRWERSSAGMKCYKCVIYDNLDTIDLVAGDCVMYVDDSGYPAHTVTADQSAASGKNIGAGIIVAAAVSTDNSRCWIQIKGFAVVSAIGGTPSDGDVLTVEAAGADKALTLMVDTTAADSLHACALVVDYSGLEIICDFPF